MITLFVMEKLICANFLNCISRPQTVFPGSFWGVKEMQPYFKSDGNEFYALKHFMSSQNMLSS